MTRQDNKMAHHVPPRKRFCIEYVFRGMGTSKNKMLRAQTAMHRWRPATHIHILPLHAGEFFVFAAIQ